MKKTKIFSRMLAVFMVLTMFLQAAPTYALATLDAESMTDAEMQAFMDKFATDFWAEWEAENRWSEWHDKSVSDNESDEFESVMRWIGGKVGGIVSSKAEEMAWVLIFGQEKSEVIVRLEIIEEKIDIMTDMLRMMMRQVKLQHYENQISAKIKLGTEANIVAGNTMELFNTYAAKGDFEGQCAALDDFMFNKPPRGRNMVEFLQYFTVELTTGAGVFHSYAEAYDNYAHLVNEPGWESEGLPFRQSMRDMDLYLAAKLGAMCTLWVGKERGLGRGNDPQVELFTKNIHACMETLSKYMEATAIKTEYPAKNQFHSGRASFTVYTDPLFYDKSIIEGIQKRLNDYGGTFGAAKNTALVHQNALISSHIDNISMKYRQDVVRKEDLHIISTAEMEHLVTIAKSIENRYEDKSVYELLARGLSKYPDIPWSERAKLRMFYGARTNAGFSEKNAPLLPFNGNPKVIYVNGIAFFNFFMKTATLLDNKGKPLSHNDIWNNHDLMEMTAHWYRNEYAYDDYEPSLIHYDNFSRFKADGYTLLVENSTISLDAVSVSGDEQDLTASVQKALEARYFEPMPNISQSDGDTVPTDAGTKEDAVSNAAMRIRDAYNLKLNESQSTRLNDLLDLAYSAAKFTALPADGAENIHNFKVEASPLLLLAGLEYVTQASNTDEFLNKMEENLSAAAYDKSRLAEIEVEHTEVIHVLDADDLARLDLLLISAAELPDINPASFVEKALNERYMQVYVDGEGHIEPGQNDCITDAYDRLTALYSISPSASQEAELKEILSEAYRKASFHVEPVDSLDAHSKLRIDVEPLNLFEGVAPNAVTPYAMGLGDFCDLLISQLRWGLENVANSPVAYVELELVENHENNFRFDTEQLRKLDWQIIGLPDYVPPAPTPINDPMPGPIPNPIDDPMPGPVPNPVDDPVPGPIYP